jgi:hypothetical protein
MNAFQTFTLWISNLFRISDFDIRVSRTRLFPDAGLQNKGPLDVAAGGPQGVSLSDRVGVETPPGAQSQAPSRSTCHGG